MNHFKLVSFIVFTKYEDKKTWMSFLQGGVEGPAEFAEGLVIGVRSVFSGVVGGAAGTVSRITGALGSGLASLTFDEKFQVKF